MYCCQDANMYEKVTSVISWNCPTLLKCPVEKINDSILTQKES